jgi:hypothetical protein
MGNRNAVGDAAMSESGKGGHYNPERRARVIELTRQGHSASAIAAFTGITKRSVTRIRSDMGVAQPPSGLPLTDDEMRRAAELLDDGCSYGETARTLGRNCETIRRHFPGRGWTRAECAEIASAFGRLAAIA